MVPYEILCFRTKRASCFLCRSYLIVIEAVASDDSIIATADMDYLPRMMKEVEISESQCASNQ